ncbi:MAG TPA: PD40 domain-containing protein [Leptolyngbyaceae cyanobacterium M65_K2018_010]|nr:PD40 domain-containing protein [Leptolyngbyaceae cyanobacterium M65_K2018_010]
MIRYLLAALCWGWLVWMTPGVGAQEWEEAASSGLGRISFATPEGLFIVQPLNSTRQTLMADGDGLVNSMVWAADGQRLAVVKNFSEVVWVDPTTPRTHGVFVSSCPRPANLEVAWPSDRSDLLIQQRCHAPDPNGQSQWDLFLVDATGQITPLTALPALVESDLYVAPDGQRIAYVANQRIYIQNLAGGAPQPLTQAPGLYSSAGSPLAWSPDGSQLAFYEGAYPYQKINLIEVDTGQRRVLTPEAEFQIYRSRLVWSPDSQRIAFYQPANPPLSNQEVITLVQVATGERQIITRPGFYNAMSWAPDSQRLAFAAGSQIEQQTLFVFDIPSNRFTALTPQPFQAILESRWTTQGDWIGFSAVALGDDLGTQTLYVVRPNATGLTAVSQPNEYAYPFAWVPLP